MNYIIAGLGNPGEKYDNTRHNAGFWSIDQLSQELGIEMGKRDFRAIIGKGRLNGQNIMLCKPQTYMNLSGESLVEMVYYYRMDPARLIILYDDVDLEPGRIRVRPKGSAGTHNGMRSIVQRLGTEDFPRVRIGIGQPPRQMDLADYVLSEPVREEKLSIKHAVELATQAAICIVCEGVDAAMQHFNGLEFDED
ncbi:MAG: aminoacyl-tRNA hydrolase [Christensenellales bacterium]